MQKISDMDDALLAEEYVKALTKIDKLKTRSSELRTSILEKSKSGVEFKGLGVSVTKRFNYDMQKCGEVYETKTGKKVPMQIIPAQEIMDVDLLKVLIKREGIREGSIGYTVKRVGVKKSTK